jgi:hypothetical protein
MVAIDAVMYPKMANAYTARSRARMRPSGVAGQR